MSDRIRVIHSYPIWLPQTQTWMYNQVKYLPENIDVHIACEITENLDQFYLPNMHILNKQSRVLQNLEKGLRHYSIRTNYGFLRSVAMETKSQIIHSHFGNIGWNNQKKVERLNVKHFVTYYGWDVNMLPQQDHRWLKRYRDLFNSGDKFLCEGPFMASSLIKMGCPQNKILVQHLGVETGNIRFIPRNWNKNESLKVFIAASFIEKKGIPYALLALNQIQKSVAIEITIIGDVNPSLRDDHEKQKILRIIHDTGLEKRTRLLGFQPYKVLFSEAYKHHIFISPSITASDGNTEGGAPVSIIEMMATGMPVISTTHCDIPNVVQYGMKDWLVDEKDVSGLATRLLWLIDNPDRWEQMSVFGRKHVESEFNSVTQGEKLASAYKSILA